MSPRVGGWRSSPLIANVLVRSLVYYVIAGGIAWLLRAYTPTAWGVMGGGGSDLGIFGSGAPSRDAAGDGGASALPAVVAMVTAFITALPVAWIYTLTRNKKGYQQSVVQTLIILPVVIAGIVVLVKHSVALAFSLGGIVAAVRFRTTLDDTKDAANIFVATGIGMAAAVAPPVAWVLSGLYNVLAVFLWLSDFGRMPAALEGSRAEKTLERALEVANRTGMFVAKLDEEVLAEMAPEQLEALAQRAWRQQKRSSADMSDEARPLPQYLLRIRCTEFDATRTACEAHFDGLFGRWKYVGKSKESDGSRVLEYAVSPLETVTVGVIKEILRRVPGELVQAVELKQ
ncbi:MAG: DUF4956 domain-containing protein [Gemmatimonadetes bacterium]|nr:DUF4956 domain-containing protein [Gemmatimonadota bacterium]